MLDPEFQDHKGIKLLFGLSRAMLYKLTADGKIRSVSLRPPGAFKGKRLWDVASVRAFLKGHYETPLV